MQTDLDQQLAEKDALNPEGQTLDEYLEALALWHNLTSAEKQALVLAMGLEKVCACSACMQDAHVAVQLHAAWSSLTTASSATYCDKQPEMLHAHAACMHDAARCATLRTG